MERTPLHQIKVRRSLLEKEGDQDCEENVGKMGEAKLHSNTIQLKENRGAAHKDTRRSRKGKGQARSRLAKRGRVTWEEEREEGPTLKLSKKVQQGVPDVCLELRKEKRG